MDTRIALESGFVGACTLTAVHEVARRVLPDAPRLDLLGGRALTRLLKTMDQPLAAPAQLQRLALVGDLVANTLYYSLVGAGASKRLWLRGILLGGLADIGAIRTPGPLGLGREPSTRTPVTQAMTIGWYLLGGLAAAAWRCARPLRSDTALQLPNRRRAERSRG